MSGLVSTFQMRLARGPHERDLERIAAHLSEAERNLHAALVRLHREAGGDAAALKGAKNALKRRFIVAFGITARQYNSLLRGLEGRHKSLRELAKSRIENTESKLLRLERKIRSRGKMIDGFARIASEVEARARAGKGPTRAQAKRLASRSDHARDRFVQHQQMRRADGLRRQVERDRAIASAAVPPVTFGSRALLRSRAELHPNDLQGIAAWRRKWEQARSAQFLVIGSKDETAGCQGCVASAAADGALTLRLRIPNALCADDGKYLRIEAGSFPEFGRGELLAALQAHIDKAPGRTAVAYRFLRDPDWPEGNTLSAWRVFITLETPVAEVAAPAFETPGTGPRAQWALGTTARFCGALGVDLNADHLAWTAIDRHGNPLKAQSGRIDLPLRGQSSARRAALIGDAAAALVRKASELDLPIVMESLDFKAKKRELGDAGARYARMLSSLAYAQIQTMIRRRAARSGVELVEVNPAYTSVIGRVNYARRYGLSAHIAAAVAIARRAARLSERINYVHGLRGRRNTLPTRCECRRHVWRQWTRVRRDLTREAVIGERHVADIASSASSTPLSGMGEGVRLRKRHVMCQESPRTG